SSVVKPLMIPQHHYTSPTTHHTHYTPRPILSAFPLLTTEKENLLDTHTHTHTYTHTEREREREGTCQALKQQKTCQNRHPRKPATHSGKVKKYTTNSLSHTHIHTHTHLKSSHTHTPGRKRWYVHLGVSLSLFLCVCVCACVCV